MRTIFLPLIFCFLVFRNQAVGQLINPPGYLGRVFSVRITAAPHLSINPALYDDMHFTGWANQGNDKNLPGLKLSSEIDVAVSRRLTIGFSLEGMRHGVAWIKEVQRNQFEYHHARIKYILPALDARWFPLLNKGNIAPVGPFTSFRIGILRTRVFSGETEPVKGELFGEARATSLRVGMGYQTMLTDRLLAVVIGYIGAQTGYDNGPNTVTNVGEGLYLPRVYGFYNSYFDINTSVSVGAGILLF